MQLAAVSSSSWPSSVAMGVGSRREDLPALRRCTLCAADGDCMYDGVQAVKRHKQHCRIQLDNVELECTISVPVTVLE